MICFMGKRLRGTRGDTVGSLSLSAVNELFHRYSDVGLAAIVVLAVAMLVVPLPAFVLDLLITLNIAIAVVVLLAGLYIREPLEMATFPTVLLLTTIFRIALEVSATRLILLKANAGHVIHAFGHFVAGGNLVVGLVVFVILTTVQFIVIAKGAARVAEVGARFTLDAMPGRQLAIDADLRAGHIDATAAGRLRGGLIRESQFYGAMDGAMKFVKGDAIAGIIVLLTNLVGGLVIGIALKGMEGGAALRTYSLLTIGEGLVAQLPALILSTAAGIVVTRVSPEQHEDHLGSAILHQILGNPRALTMAAGLLAILALVPGLPAAPFLLLAFLLGVLAFGAMTNRQRAQRDCASHPALLASTWPPSQAPLIVPLSVHLSRDLATKEMHRRLTTDLLPALRERFFDERGIALPPVRVRVDAALPNGACLFCLNEIPIETVQLAPASPNADVVAEQFARILHAHAHRLVGVDATQALLADLERSHPHLVRAVVPNVVSVVVLAGVLECLAREGISLRYLADILSALTKHVGASNTSAALLAESVRAGLVQPITHKHAQPDGSVAVYYLDPLIEETVREAVARDPSGATYLAIEPALAEDIVRAVAVAVSGTRAPVILTARDIRRHVRDLLAGASLPVAVLAHQDLAPEVKLHTLGRIGPVSP